MRHEVAEGPNDLGVFHMPAAIDGLRRGVIMKMTCRWCLCEMEIVPSQDPGATAIRNPETGEVRMETIGLRCPTCDYPPPNPKEQWQ